MERLTEDVSMDPKNNFPGKDVSCLSQFTSRKTKAPDHISPE